jgi:flagellar biosynthesis/type III secretory pathway protein FliH
MSLFNWFEDEKSSSQVEHEQAYNEGREEAANEGLLGGLIHDATDMIPVPWHNTSEQQSHEAGYHDEREGRR